ncbi:hypothetical protein LOD99_1167 [Oopsacas minuta]|uniref:Uncharacterized protein n=1 Tax=Oopsacas minuta TaxID=111878 RepID=A0AAV7K528_9METZ|nr:hypothetical protein LOD99_1167 [Oopsacas minuta]
MRGSYRDPRVPHHLLSKPGGDIPWQNHHPFQPTRHNYIHVPQPRHPLLPLPTTSPRDIGDVSLPNLLHKDAKGYLMNLPPQNRCRAVLTAINLFLFKHDSRDPIEKLLSLADEFLLGIKGDKLSSCVELLNLDEIATFLAGLSSLENRLTLFDALFSCARRDPNQSVAQSREVVLCRLVSLAVCAPYPSILELSAYIMQDQSDTAKSIARSLYHDYFQLLPSASKPLEVVYQHSTSFAAQLLIAYTKLYPIFQANIHSAMSMSPGCLSPINQPPMPLISMIATWMNKRPDLCHIRAPHIPESLPLLHQRSSVTQIQNTPLTGIIAWTTLAPLLQGLRTSTHNTSGTESDELDFYSQIHVNMLSAVHQYKSNSVTKGIQCISSEDLSTVVANLIGLAGFVGIAQPGSEHFTLLHDSIDRIAQSIQMCLFADLLHLSRDHLASIAATLPRNSLLDIVIEHHTHNWN